MGHFWSGKCLGPAPALSPYRCAGSPDERAKKDVGLVTVICDRYSYHNERRIAIDAWGTQVQRIAARQPCRDGVVRLQQKTRPSPLRHLLTGPFRP